MDEKQFESAEAGLEPCLRIEAVARLLDVSVQRAYELVRTGQLPAIRLGRQVRVSPQRLKEWMEAGGQPRSASAEDAA